MIICQPSRTQKGFFLRTPFLQAIDFAPNQKMSYICNTNNNNKKDIRG